MSDFAAFLRALRPEVEAELDRLLPAESEPPEDLHAAMRYSVFAGGKRVRPALVVLAGESYGARRELLLPGAAALEMIHTFSLVHDDLPALDDDDLRRGQPTVHRRFGEATAVLVGDALLNLGLATLAERPESLPAERLRGAVSLIAAAVGTRGMIGGQMADLEAESEWPSRPQEALEEIHRRKTGALITSSVRLGGLYAGVSREEDERLRRLGDRIGLMFQIADDILDVEGTVGELGKAVNKDAEARKLTYPGLYGLAESKEMLRRVDSQARELAAGLSARESLFPSLIDYLSTRDR